MPTLDRDQITARIKKAVTDKGGPEKFARSLDVTPEYIGHLLRGKQPGPKVLKVIKVVQSGGIYRELESEK